MSNAQLVKVPNGGTLAIRSGILRGAGPQGPIGPPGAKGDKGDAGPQGPAGTITALMTKISSTSGVGVSFDKWYPLALDTRAQDDLLVPGSDPLNLQFKTAMTVLMVGVARWETTHAPSDGGTAAGSRQLRWVDASGAVLNNAEGHVEAAHNEPTLQIFVAVLQPDPSKFYHLEGLARDDIGVNCSQRWFTFCQIGAGPPGVQGPPGPVGSTGAQGPIGIPGSAGSGYAQYNLVANGSPDTTLEPAGSTYLATADQGLRVPAGTDLPATPWFLQRLARDVEPLLVSRYSSAANRATKRAARSSGEVTYLDDTGSLQFREKVGGSDNNIARVIVSTATPPTGSGQAAPGVLWIQV